MEYLAKHKKSGHWAFSVEPDGKVLLTKTKARARPFDGRWRQFLKKDFDLEVIPTRRSYSNVPLKLLIACQDKAVRLELTASFLSLEHGEGVRGTVAVRVDDEVLEKIGGLRAGEDHGG